MLILALHLAVRIISTPDFSLEQILVQDLLLQSFLKVTTSLDDARKCFAQCISIEKEKIKLFLTGLCSLSHFITCSFIFMTSWFCLITRIT